MLKVVANVFGEYTHGYKKGHVNPNASVLYTGYGTTVVKAMKSLSIDGDMPIYKIESVTPVN